MARIGVMTFLHNDNFGSSLQAYALQRVLREMGHECEHIDYLPDDREKLRNLIKSGNSIRLVLEGMRKKRVKAGQAGARQKSSAIPEFYKRRMKMSPRCRNGKELKKISGRYDILLCGSDQIWNPVWMNPAYFLNFSGNQQRIAYAASLGVSRLDSGKKAGMIRRLLHGFDAVSVREEEGADLLENITGSRPEVMPDPVCLLRKEDWEEIAGEKPSEDPYLVCYFIGENPEYWEKARRISREKNLRMLTIPVTEESYQNGGELLDGIGPEAFLGAIRGADTVLTDSFHALAFSAILEKKCELCRRYRDDDPESKNSRIDHFRREIGRNGPEQMREKGLCWLKQQIRA